MKKNILISLILAYGIFAYSHCQTGTLKLWPQGVPNSISDDHYKEHTVKSWGRDCWANVTDPELLIYKAPEEKATGTAIIICPGGAYARISYTQEGNAVATWLNEKGITAIILKYRLPSDSIMNDKSIGPLQDAQRAIRIVRHNASQWNIDPTKIGIMGFSAGGHVASSLCTHYNDKVYEPIDTTSARPDFSVLVYPVISMIDPVTHMGSRINLLGTAPDTALIIKFSNELQVSPDTPPAFLVHSADDDAVPFNNSINYFKALRKNNVTCELHIYQSGGHGYGLAKNGDTQSQWPEACLRWLKSNGF
jgi:acetyl esterase/lipase